mmetsp:Transcript_16677/g.18786  ORF Transcript_16677/g.18786 Transcript_16677/m.18786 type:complete len:216 (+) Transcript_16677:621-1268(+)
MKFVAMPGIIIDTDEIVTPGRVIIAIFFTGFTQLNAILTIPHRINARQVYEGCIINRDTIHPIPIGHKLGHFDRGGQPNIHPGMFPFSDRTTITIITIPSILEKHTILDRDVSTHRFGRQAIMCIIVGQHTLYLDHVGPTDFDAGATIATHTHRIHGHGLDSFDQNAMLSIQGDGDIGNEDFHDSVSDRPFFIPYILTNINPIITILLNGATQNR